MKKIFFLILFIVTLVYSQKRCKCKYNQEPYYDCCVLYEEKLEINKFFDSDIYEILIEGLMKSLLTDEATLPVPPPQTKQPEPEPMEDIQYPLFDTIEGAMDVYNYNNEIENAIVYNENWIKLINDISNELDTNRLADNGFWDNNIKNYQWWNVLPANYQPMTQLLRQSLYFKRNLNMLIDVNEFDYKPMDDVIYNSNNLRYLNEYDNVVQNLNHVRNVFQNMYLAFINEKNIDEVKKLYFEWNAYIDKNFEDGFAPYKKGTTKYLNVLIANWVNSNSGSQNKQDLITYIIKE
jgi:hypothetical protein